MITLEQEFDELWYREAYKLYNKTGFLLLKFDVNTINKFLIDAQNKYNWRSKYNGTIDLIHDSASKLFIENIIHTIVDYNIPTILDEVTMSELTLVHVQVRKAEQSTFSYMSWHRDTYIDSNNNWVGNVPAVHKLIIYPIDDDGLVRNQLDIISRSHRMTVDNIENDVQIMKLNNFEIDSIQSSNNSAVLFNTVAMHRALPTSSLTGSWRIICSFATKQQLQRRFNNDPIHTNINSFYKRIITNV